MDIVDCVVVNQIYKSFEYSKSRRVFDDLQNTQIPMSSSGPLYRIQIAALWTSNGDLGLLNRSLKVAMADWRDLLMGADLGNEDWKEKFLENGIPIIIDNKYIAVESLDVYEANINAFFGEPNSKPENRVSIDFINMINLKVSNENVESLQHFKDIVVRKLRISYPFLTEIASEKLMQYLLKDILR